MALKWDEEIKGYRIKTDADLVEAAELKVERDNEVKEIYEETGLNELMEDSRKLAEAMAIYMTSKRKDKVELEGGHFTRIQKYSRRWIPDVLKERVGKNMWLRITDSTPNAAKIEEQIKLGNLKQEDIEDAFEEHPQNAYVQYFGDKEKPDDEEVESVKAALSTRKQAPKKRSKR